ncbi:protein of unknown function DUF208 [Thermodesulfobium narugense DSM 14796]|uniref:Epoxyqueuosine reductase QueH n=1 Tax=Thermodesulfobium narugense DSM 14796 TaxID=747365 RepID=M1E722_9BACT|nr:epoxyqueuosine reductase QueH [Thermodesulfobium narugense]AEE14285.1 protein of unknown function DUF208 [Thermodesulfobium narugense DSM 14796]
MKVLLHTCCGPCASGVIPWFRAQGLDFVSYYYNPNIHPFSEYEKRRLNLEEVARILNFEVLYSIDWEVERWINNFSSEERCSNCIFIRLERTAKLAKDLGFDAFSTTLSISPYQSLEIIKNCFEEISNKYKIDHVFKNFRSLYQDSIKFSKENGIYRQHYCGCIISEYNMLMKKRARGDKI